MKTINKIIGTVVLALIFTVNIFAKTDSLPNTVIERNHVNAQMKILITEQVNASADISNSQHIIVKMMLDENGKALEVKVFCDNIALKEKLENKFKSISFKDFQDYTYYYFKVSINKV